MKKILKCLLSAAIVFSSILGNGLTSEKINAADNKEYPVTADAYIRNGGKENVNYDFENITKAHGAQYEGLNYKVINVKNYGTSEIIAVMKLTLPTQDEVAENGFDQYLFEFNIFKNPGFQNGPQTYHFYYTADTDWEEKSITWNNKPSSITRNATDLLFDFTIDNTTEYEILSDEEKHIRVDISDKIESLIADGVKEITIFTTAEQAKDTSLMIHSKESGDGSRTATLTAEHIGYSQEMLFNLIQDCKALSPDKFSAESYENLLKALETADHVHGQENAELSAIRNAYKSLLEAKNALSVI